jgi:hypothetical protein
MWGDPISTDMDMAVYFYNPSYTRSTFRRFMGLDQSRIRHKILSGK